MRSKLMLISSPFKLLREIAAVICIGTIAPGTAFPASPVSSPAPVPQTANNDQPAAKLPADQLDSLVAPIALYPDPMLSQTLIASTYPLEVIQLKQWLDQNKNLQGKALADAVEKQDWDPSIQSLAGLPEVVKLLSDNIKWTTDLGNAFLAQQDDVMAAVQRMRQKAQGNGNLKSTEQQKVEVKTVESKQVIVIEQANPEVVYVPSYNPTVVYGAPVYAYPPIAYPPPGYYAAGMAISFGVGVAMGAFWGGGGWCCGCGWGGGGNNININNNNNFVRNSNSNFNRQNVGNGNRQNMGNGNRQNIGNGNRPSQMPAGGRSNWQHNPQHRGGAPYSDRQLANKYGGTARGDSLTNRQNNARQNIGRQQGTGNFGGGNRQQGQGLGGGNRQQGAGVANRQQGGIGDRGGAGTRDASNRGGGGNLGGNRGGGDRVGNQRVPNSPSGSNRSAFGGSGTSGRDARASQSRGSSSFGGSRGGGGGSRSGGGGRRGGGGGGRRR